MTAFFYPSSGGGGGTVAQGNAGSAGQSWYVQLTNIPTVDVGNTVAVTGTVAISGTPTVSVSNFPATQPISGAVAVSNFPATQPVSGTVTVVQGNAGSSGQAWYVQFPATPNVNVANTPTVYGALGNRGNVTFASTANAYTAGQSIGTTIATTVTRANDTTGVIMQLNLIDTSNTKPPIDILFFSQTPTNAPADRTTWNIAIGDIPNLMGRVSVLSTDWQSYGSAAQATKAGLGIFLKPAAGQQYIYLVAIIQGTATLVANCIGCYVGMVLD